MECFLTALLSDKRSFILYTVVVLLVQQLGNGWQQTYAVPSKILNVLYLVSFITYTSAFHFLEIVRRRFRFHQQETAPIINNWT